MEERIILSVSRVSGAMNAAHPQAIRTALDSNPALRVAVILPCLNEGAEIAQVVAGFHKHLPDAEIHVFDNASTDNTAEAARAAGATVHYEPRRGKGHVVCRMFRDVDADVYVMADGDATYDPAAAPDMIGRMIAERLDVVIGARRHSSSAAYRPGHRFGNLVLTGFAAQLFGRRLRDMMSGYRVMSRRFVKSCPLGSAGFEIETELTLHMFQIGAPFVEVDVPYRERSAQSASKLRTLPDGLRVLATMLRLLVLERPVAVFGGAGTVALVLALAMFLPVLSEYQTSGAVPRFPTLIASGTLGLGGMIAIFSGFILSGITRTRQDMKRLAYLAQPSRTAA